MTGIKSGWGRADIHLDGNQSYEHRVGETVWEGVPVKTGGQILLLVASCAVVGVGLTGCGSAVATSQTTLQDRGNVIQTAPTETVQVGDIRMAYKILGAGTPLVLIMGYGSTMDIWDARLVEDLAKEYQVILFDNRGMGGSTASSADFTIEQFADDTAGLMDAIGVVQAHVLAWSMGTNIAEELVLRHPEKVDMLVLYAGDVGGEKMIPPSAEVLKQVEDTSGTAEERGKRFTEVLFPEDWMQANPDFWNLMPRPTETADPGNIAKQAQAMGAWKGCYERIAGIVCPTLLITGTEDALTPAANTTMMADLMPGAWVARFADGGHGLMYQYPHRLAGTVLGFFENCRE